MIHFNLFPVILSGCVALSLLCSCRPFYPDGEKQHVTVAQLDEKLDESMKKLPGVDCPEAESYRNFITKDEKTYIAFHRFMRAVVIAKNKYVDEEASTYEQLFEKALQGMLNNLDPYCSYERKKGMDEYQKELSGEIAGIGVTVTTSGRALRVVNVFKGGPAERAGIRTGDMIIAVDDVQLARISLEQHLKLIPGPAGEKVKLRVHRPSNDSLFTLTVTREIINVPSVLGGNIIDKERGIGYIALTEFGGKTDAEFATAMESLTKAGMKSLVLDLRDNPGGLVATAVSIASYFVPEGQPVVSLESRNPKENATYKAIPRKNRYKLPIAILINGDSASAAEILAACLRDYNLAVLIGETSFGKGVVQTFLPLGQEEVMKITTSRYLTPKKHMIHGNGIKPDIAVGVPLATQTKLAYQREMHPGIVNPPVYGAVKDVVLERAVNVLSAMRILQK